jgi:hypothetical protein
MKGGAMSESRFLNQHTQQFSSSHPHGDGWKVYEFSEILVAQHGFHKLLDFLRDCHPLAITHRATIKTIVGQELIGDPTYPHPAERGTEWDVGQDLNGDEWYGVLHVEWMGQPIHIWSFFIYTGRGYSNVFHVATRSNAAMRDLFHALRAHERSKRKDVRKITVINGDDIPIQEVSWEDVILPAALADGIRRNVTAFFQGEDRYRTLGIPYRRGMLFAGPPGCGKTVTLKALAYHSTARVITVLGTAGVEDHHIEAAFRMAADGPAIVLFEDVDKLMQSEHIALSYFLNLLDGLRTLNGVLIIATANEPEKLDPALLYRPSRFDCVWTFPLPDKEQRLALLKKRGLPYFSDAALEDAAERSKGFSMAYVQEILVNALLEPAHRGADPSDSDLLSSLEALRLQRRHAGSNGGSVQQGEPVGFTAS